MSTLGTILLVVAFASLAAGTISSILTTARAGGRQDGGSGRPDALGRVGRVALAIAFAALTIGCLVIVYCFFSGNNSLEYVVEYRSKSNSSLAWLFTLSGLWAGRQGSLLFWSWLISAYTLFVTVRVGRRAVRVDHLALAVVQVVLAAFVGVLLFSASNNPFAASPDTLVNADGSLTAMGSLYGMNKLLEHWAMAVHPPALFIGYAGMTIPFAYALSTMLLGDDSDLWVRRVIGVTRFAWLFLGIGIGLGSVWAYVVLGWGGYWGWDPVENASLLSWLTCVALIHSLSAYRKHGAFKRWSVVTACLTFMFVIVGTFISRSGLVQSVHAFEGDSVSLVFFVILIMFAGAAAIFGAVGRRKSFAVPDDDDDSALISREMGFFLLDVVMVIAAFVIAYFTICSAFPSWMPLGGVSVATSTYNAIARPLGIFLLAIIAICPLTGWRRTNPKSFWSHAAIPGICAAGLFVILLVYFATTLLPAYNATIAQGGSVGEALADAGPAWYYNGLAVVGFAVASLLVFNSLFLFVRLVGSAHGSHALRARIATIGGSVAHLAMGIILIGLIGSSMYVTEVTGYVAHDDGSDASPSLTIGDYELVPTGSSAVDAGGDGYLYFCTMDVYYTDGSEGDAGRQLVSSVAPSVQLDPMTQQQKLNASVLSFPFHDLFVVYRGVNTNEDYSLDVRINPLISLVWIGFVLLMVGTALGLFSPRADGEGSRRQRSRTEGVDDAATAGSADAEPTSPEGQPADANDNGVSASSVAEGTPGQAGHGLSAGELKKALEQLSEDDLKKVVGQMSPDDVHKLVGRMESAAAGGQGVARGGAKPAPVGSTSDETAGGDEPQAADGAPHAKGARDAGRDIDG